MSEISKISDILLADDVNIVGLVCLRSDVDAAKLREALVALDEAAEKRVWLAVVIRNVLINRAKVRASARGL